MSHPFYPPSQPPLTRRAAIVLVAAIALPRARAQTPDPQASTRWQQVRRSLFGDRPIADSGDAVIRLETPLRAEDAAIVPIALHAAFDQSSERFIRQVTLVIDNNPSPIAAVFRYTLASGRADIETRVRIDEYTFVRAIAETNDGALHMSSRFVKAAGGCSAPPGKDAVAARAAIGRMRLRVQPGPAGKGPVLAQLMISHPNDSGLAMDQMTRLYTPAHFVRSVEVSYGGRPVLSADLDFAISENPHLRFYFKPGDGDGQLSATVVDTQDLRFETSIGWRPSP
jgi:sulfur-oxidizing protein SoxY